MRRPAYFGAAMFSIKTRGEQLQTVYLSPKKVISEPKTKSKLGILALSSIPAAKQSGLA